MALDQVAQPAPMPKKKGGILGAVLSVAQPVAGLIGLTVPGAETAAKAASTAIQGAGAVNALTQSSNNPVPQGDVPLSAGARRIASDPQATLAQLNQSQMALMNADPLTQQTYGPFLAAAKQKIGGANGSYSG